MSIDPQNGGAAPGAPSPNPPAPTPPGNTPTPTPGSGPQDWTTGLNDELKGYVQTKGFKAPQDVLESYRNFEKLQGVPAERILKLPENIDSDEGRAIFEKLGRPKEAKGYSFEFPKEVTDQKLNDELREFAFQNNFTQKQLEGLAKWWGDRQVKAIGDRKTALAAKATEAEQKLKTDWGAKFEENSNAAMAAAQASGITDQELAVLGQVMSQDKLMKLLHMAGTTLGEHAFHTGGPAGGQQTAEQAKNEIARLQTDPGFISRLRSKDADASKKWSELHVAAYPGTTSL